MNSNSVNKPKIWHLIGDKRAGGSNHLVRNLIASPLSDRFEFSMLRLEDAKKQLNQGISPPELIIFHYPCAWKYLADFIKLRQYSPIYLCDHHYCQGFEQHQVNARWRFRVMLKLFYGMAKKVISVSKAQRQWMLEANLTSSEKIITIPPASPVDKLLQIPIKAPGQPLVLGAYGRFAPQKGFDRLLQALAKVPAHRVHLQLGGYGPDEAIIRHLAQGLPHVSLLGAVQDVPQFLANCDVVVIPSRWEPWGLVALEAKAAGKPILATAVDGLPEQVHNHAQNYEQDYGLLVPPDDLTALIQAIVTLTETPLTPWGTAGRMAARGAWDRFLRAWEILLSNPVELQRP